MQESKDVIKSGEIITCPNCSKELLRVAVDIHPGDEILAGAFEPIGDFPTPIDGQAVPVCCGSETPILMREECGFPVVQIHTAAGWRLSSFAAPIIKRTVELPIEVPVLQISQCPVRRELMIQKIIKNVGDHTERSNLQRFRKKIERDLSATKLQTLIREKELRDKLERQFNQEQQLEFMDRALAGEFFELKGDLQ